MGSRGSLPYSLSRMDHLLSKSFLQSSILSKASLCSYSSVCLAKRQGSHGRTFSVVESSKSLPQMFLHRDLELRGAVLLHRTLQGDILLRLPAHLLSPLVSVLKVDDLAILMPYAVSLCHPTDLTSAKNHQA